MIYAMYGDPGLIPCESARDAMDLIVERRWLPNRVMLWRAETALVPIGFEDLQEELGHRRLGIDEVMADISAALELISQAGRARGVQVTNLVQRMEVSTSGIPWGKPSVQKVYGNPCARVDLRISMLDGVYGGLGKCDSLTMRLMVEESDNGGWNLIHSEAGALLKVPGMRPYRAVTAFLSKPREMFDEIEVTADEQ